MMILMVTEGHQGVLRTVIQTSSEHQQDKELQRCLLAMRKL
jgi:hypothetical protein